MRRGDLVRVKAPWRGFDPGDTFVVEDAQHQLSGALNVAMNLASRLFSEKDMRTVTSVRLRCTACAAHPDEVGTFLSLLDADDVAYLLTCVEVVGRDPDMDTVPTWLTLLLVMLVVGGLGYMLAVHLMGDRDDGGAMTTFSGTAAPRFANRRGRVRRILPTRANFFASGGTVHESRYDYV